MKRIEQEITTSWSGMGSQRQREFQGGDGDGGKMYRAYFPCFMMLSGDCDS